MRPLPWLPAVLSLCACEQIAGYDTARYDPARSDPPDAGEPVPAQPIGQTGDWVLTFHDEFDGTALDANRWAVGYPFGTTHSVSTETVRAENVHVSGGLLELHAELGPADAGVPFYSGAVSTWNLFSQQYGYFEARFKGAAGPGLVSSFWGDPGQSWPPSIQVAEVFGGPLPSDPTWSTRRVQLSDAWGPSDAPANFDKEAYELPAGSDFAQEFHVFGCEWTATERTWYVDGVQRATFSDAADQFTGAFTWMLNLQVCNEADYGCPDATNHWPAVMQVDWVRMWARP